MNHEVQKIIAERMPDVYAFRETLSPETDRGCALMAAAYLDDQLSALLAKCFVEDNAVQQQIFSNSGPLGTFSSRIDLAYLLGLIPQRVRRELHLIRKIRNDFGHNPQPIGFESDAIANRCKELNLSSREQIAKPRSHFTSSVLGVLALIHVAIKHREAPQSASDIQVTEKMKQTAKTIAEEGGDLLLDLLEYEP
ncbi:MAG: hypothetical protein EOM26_07610 [Alphaproteobacteria bacterium]|nr:hypothetical protein [Alphaproteobacteria bacterium]